ncbi:peptidylprolyl isomerase [Methylovorus sp. MM2]|uniref:SurA N-terminal domain-containing protein n=1 Tax=Methylovorus sp. MM2 TaxID=1848038 RepID=UPI0007E25656|nr:SurA N-terminal domain-containing protein [Methylovorus sp. MM2]OAM52947.1 peptidylprolyl isomerase [Methylovorus sp. MM2]
MLDAIREHSKGWLAKVILAAITIPFALVGIDTYLRDAGSNVPIAKVGSESISVQEYGNSLQKLRNQLQEEGKTDPSVLDNPDVKRSILDRLIATKLINAEANHLRFIISDDQVHQYLLNMPQFQQDGAFSEDLYYRLLSSNRMSASQFENSLRADMLLQQTRQGIVATAYNTKAAAEHALSIEHQQREVSVAEIKTADFLTQVKVDPAEVKAFYDKHQDNFRVPDQVKLEFVLMSASSLIQGIQVTDQEVKQEFEKNASKFQGDEQRQASHILIGFGVSATPETKQAAKKKAQEILAEVKQSPTKFAELAKKYSQDPGSKDKGGDLGAFGRGMMVKPFEDAVYSMQPGQVSDLVESEFGYHIIKLTGITGQAQSFDAVKAQLKGDLLYQKALAKFSEQAENFSNMVYEQSTSLQPVADAFGIQVQTSAWLTRADGAKFFKSDKLMNSVFSDEVLKDRRNTEAVEVSSNNLVAARVVDYKPASPRTFDEVKAGIEDYLKLEKASKLAAEKGEAALAGLKQGKDADHLEWIPPVTVDRKNAQGLTELTMSNVFKIDTSKLPAYTGALNSNKGYQLIKVTKVSSELAEDDSAKKAAAAELKSALAAEYLAAYVESLKAKAKVNINEQLLSAGSLTQ